MPEQITRPGALYRVAWRSKRTGATGRGQEADSREQAQAWADRANRDCPQIEHWAEPAGLDALDILEATLRKA